MNASTQTTPCLTVEPVVFNADKNLSKFPSTVAGLLDLSAMEIYGAQLHLVVVSPRYHIEGAVAFITPLDTAEDMLRILVDFIEPHQWPRLLQLPEFPMGTGECFIEALIDLRTKMRSVPYNSDWCLKLSKACWALQKHCDDSDQTLEVVKIFQG